MGLHDRRYMQEDDGEGSSGRLRLGLPKPTPLTLGLMIACAAVFLVCLFTGRFESPLFRWFSLIGAKAYQIWRFITFQFMHGYARHFMWNLVGLYFFAPPLERAWGQRRFLGFYLGAGIVSGLCFLVMAAVLMGDWWDMIPLVGASGGILACLAACAILYPEMIVLIFPIRWVAAFLTVLYVLSIMWDKNLSDAAHLGGMAAAAAYLLAWPKVRRRLGRGDASGLGRWERKLRRERARQEEIDRILDKIRQKGIGSLSRKEKRTLRQETQDQRGEGPP